MPKTIKFTEKECEVVRELLEQERGNLRPEIRHTDSPTVHDELEKRLETVNGILQQLACEPAKTVTGCCAIR